MKIYEAKDDERLEDAIFEMIEKDTGKKIFTIRVFDHQYVKTALECVVVFEDKSVLMGSIYVNEMIKGKAAFRLKGNFV